MRILKVSPTYYPYLAEGGRPAKVRGIARALVKRGHTVTILTTYEGSPPEAAGLHNLERVPRGYRAQHDGGEVLYLDTSFRYRSVALNRGVIDFCHERVPGFDVVHVYGLYDLLGPVVGWHCRRLGIPYMVEPLGMMQPMDRSVTLKRTWKRMGKRYLNCAARMVATSEQERQEFVREGVPADRIFLRYNGVDLEEFHKLPPRGIFRRKLGFGNGERLILFLGRIIPRKGADHLIEALTEIAGTRAQLIIAGPEGESGYIQFLQTKAAAAGVKSQVLFPGPIYEQDKMAALVDADIFVLPSRYENFGNSVAEAMACDTPVIVTESCGIAALVKDKAGLVIPYDPKALARSLSALLSDTSLYRRLKAGCKEVVSQISWDGLAEVMQQGYERVISGRPPISSEAGSC